MNKINAPTTSLLEIKRSKFITRLYPVTSIQEVELFLEEVKKEYKDASHYCYAYIIDQQRKSSDDGEPGGTAGVPMMEILNKNDMNYILCIVIRYFGGIKLGAGGLVRAYSNSVKLALSNSSIQGLQKGYRIKIITAYCNESKLIQMIGKGNILKKQYNQNLEVEAEVSVNVFQKLYFFHPQIIKDIWL